MKLKEYTVKKGDCLWNIAKSELGDALRWPELFYINNQPESIKRTGLPIFHEDLIFVDQVILIPDETGEPPAPQQSPSRERPVIKEGRKARTLDEVLIPPGIEVKRPENGGKGEAFTVDYPAVQFKLEPNMEFGGPVAFAPGVKMTSKIKIEGSVSIQLGEGNFILALSKDGVIFELNTRYENAIQNLCRETKLSINPLKGELILETGFEDNSHAHGSIYRTNVASTLKYDGSLELKANFKTKKTSGTYNGFNYEAGEMTFSCILLLEPDLSDPEVKARFAQLASLFGVKGREIQRTYETPARVGDPLTPQQRQVLAWGLGGAVVIYVVARFPLLLPIVVFRGRFLLRLMTFSANNPSRLGITVFSELVRTGRLNMPNLQISTQSFRHISELIKQRLEAFVVAKPLVSAKSDAFIDAELARNDQIQAKANAARIESYRQRRSKV